MERSIKKENHIAYISLGSNLGDKLKNCKKGIKGITDSGDAKVIAISQFYATEPQDYKKQDWFVNSVAKIDTPLDPFSLLKTLKSIEKMVGREAHSIRFGPRVLDLDILLFDETILTTDALSIPHPRTHKRRFVLKPICDIDPDMNHPVLKKNMRHLLDHLDTEAQEIKVIKED